MVEDLFLDESGLVQLVHDGVDVHPESPVVSQLRVEGSAGPALAQVLHDEPAAVRLVLHLLYAHVRGKQSRHSVWKAERKTSRLTSVYCRILSLGPA